MDWTMVFAGIAAAASVFGVFLQYRHQRETAPLINADQEHLLQELVEYNEQRRAAGDQYHYFHFFTVDQGPKTLITDFLSVHPNHPHGIPKDERAFSQADIEALNTAGYIAITKDGGISRRFRVTPQGERYIKNRNHPWWRFWQRG